MGTNPNKKKINPRDLIMGKTIKRPKSAPVRKVNNLGLFKMPEKILVIGDIHADYEALVYTLKKAGIINNNLEWTGRKTYVVFIGDLVDGKNRIGRWKGDSDLRVLRLINKLMMQAKIKGGEVIVLLGNHEIMNMRGNLSYSGEKGIKEFGGSEKRIEYFNNDFKSFAKKCYLVVKIGKWVFCHAGIIPEISLQYSIPKINSQFMKFLNNKMNTKEENLFLDIISGDEGILTTREFGNDVINCNRLMLTLKYMKADHMVVGHTVQDKINSVCNAKLWRVDVGISRAFGEDFKKRVGFLLIYKSGKKVKIY